MRVEYSSNNSGGHWWLRDEQWKKLEQAGWKVNWFKNQKRSMFKADKDGRWLGALAAEATREGLPLRAAVEEWEAVTGASATDAGCPCCGQPHSFTEYDDEGNWVKSGPTTRYEASWD